MRDGGSRRVALVNLGCRVNRVELDAMALELQQRDCQLVGEREAEVIVVNTCAVTGEAQAKTRKAIRHAARQPQHPMVVATGCVASLFSDELAAISPQVVVEADKRKVTGRVLEMLARHEASVVDPGAHVSAVTRTTPTGRTRPGIKVQDGCDNRCTFCIVWKARGHSRSVDERTVVEEVRAAQERGAHEVVLTGINLGSYRLGGSDDPERGLPELLRLLLAETDVERIRLSSIEPPDVTERLLATMAEAGERVAPFLHVCLQSGCDRTLREMGRVYDTAAYGKMVDMARRVLPDLSLGTDLIVGFPGESDDDFERSLSFCEQMAFSRMHVFRYSRRPGTPAAERSDQTPPAVSAARCERMMALAARMRHEQAMLRVGKEELVVVQHPDGRGVTGGLFDALVGEAHPLDSLVRATVHGVLPDATLDARC